MRVTDFIEHMDADARSLLASITFWIAIPVALVLLISFCVGMWRTFGVMVSAEHRRRKYVVRILRSFWIALLSALLLVGLITLHVGTFFARDFLPDLTVSLPESGETVVIREWSWLLVSGVEVYRSHDGGEVFLGEFGGWDDGYTPFVHGDYEIVDHGDGCITVRAVRGASEYQFEKSFSLYPTE